MIAKQALRECPIVSTPNDAELEEMKSLAVEKQYEAVVSGLDETRQVLISERMLTSRLDQSQ